MFRRIALLAAAVTLGPTATLATADVVQLSTQTLSGYSRAAIDAQELNGQFTQVFEQYAYNLIVQTTGPLGYAPGDQVIQTVSAPPGERFVVTPGSTQTYLSVTAAVAHQGSASGINVPNPTVTFAGLDGAAPQADSLEFTTGADASSSNLEFFGQWGVAAPFSFTSLTFTGSVPQEPAVTNATFNDVQATLHVYEPDPPGSSADQLLSVQPIPEPAGMLVLLAAPFLLLRRRRALQRRDANL